MRLSHVPTTARDAKHKGPDDVVAGREIFRFRIMHRDFSVLGRTTEPFSCPWTQSHHSSCFMSLLSDFVHSVKRRQPHVSALARDLFFIFLHWATFLLQSPALAHFGIDPHYIHADQKATVLTDKESDMFEMKRGTKQGDLLSSMLFNTVLQAALEDDLARWREKRSGISLGVLQADCLSNLRFAEDVLFVHYIPGAAQKYDVRLQEMYRKRMSGNPRRKDENSLQPRIKQKKRGDDRQHQSRGVASERTCEVSRSDNNFRTTGDNWNQESNQSSMGIMYPEKTGVNIESTSATTQASLIQHGHHSCTDTRLWNMDPLECTRKNDQVDTSQDASPHHFRQSENTRQKKEKQRRKEDKKRWGASKRWESRRKRRMQQKLGRRDRRRWQLKRRLRPRQRSLTHGRHRWRYWPNWNWRRDLPKKRWGQPVSLAGSWHTKRWTGYWQWGLLLSQRQDGHKKQQNGIQVSAVDSKHSELWEDREGYGETTSINSSSLRKHKKPRKWFEEHRHMDADSERPNKMERNWKILHKERVRKVLKMEGIPASDDIPSSPQCTRWPLPLVSDAIRAQPKEASEKTSTSTWSPSSQRSSWIWAWWAQTRYVGRARHIFLWILLCQTFVLQDPQWRWLVIV